MASFASRSASTRVGGTEGVAVANTQNMSISFSTLYDGLNDDGDWMNYGGNYVFVPADARDDWRP
jgi:hypothetical protein